MVICSHLQELYVEEVEVTGHYSEYCFLTGIAMEDGNTDEPRRKVV